MEGNRNVNPALYTIALSGLTAVVAYLLIETDLKSLRPKGSDTYTQTVPGEQNRLARLWEDPISIEAAKTPSPCALEALQAQINDLVSKGHSVMIMPVMIEGFPYAETSETRLRFRYSVVNGLLDSSYLPSDGTHLGLLSIGLPLDKRFEERSVGSLVREISCPSEPERSVVPPDQHQTNSVPGSPTFLKTGYLPSSAEKELPSVTRDAPPADVPRGTIALSVPFEWYSGNQDVLVLWLREERFSKFPLRKLIYLTRALVGNSEETLSNVTTAVIGPSSSDTLKEFTWDLEPDEDKDIGPWIQHLSVFSASASAPDALLYPRKVMAGADRDYTSFWINRPALKEFKSLVTTDARLAETLVGELHLRGIEVGTNSQDQILLVSESDTSYGRSLPISFSAAFAGYPNTSDSSYFGELLRFYQTNPVPRNIFRATYLRGLDGKTPFQKSTEKKEDGDAGKQSNDLSQNSEPEKAEGASQLDYCRRLASEIKASFEQDRFKRKQPRAIGVLGSDIYDKIVLLQALRHKFPESIFFTTDIDARYLNKGCRENSRTLLVASSSNLEPASPAGILRPPFRDSYQAAIYRATRLAVGSLPFVSPTSKLFQVGRTKLFELSASRTFSSESLWWYIAIPIFVLMLTYFVFGDPRARFRPGLAKPTAGDKEERLLRHLGLKERGLWLVLGFITYMVIGAVYLKALAGEVDPSGEPVAFTQSISAWPTIMIRLLSISAVILFLITSWYRHRRHRLRLRREFFGKGERYEFSKLCKTYENPDTRTVCKKLKSGLTLLGSSRKAFGISGWKSPVKPSGGTRDLGKINAAELFYGYVERGKFCHRMSRVLPWGLAYAGVSFFMIWYFGLPMSPYRNYSLGLGISLKMLDTTTLGVSIVAYCILAFYVLDAVRLSRKMIKHLATGVTEWPTRVQDFWSGRKVMKAQHLDGFLDVLFVQKHTEEIYSLIFFPAVVLLLMLIARAPIFAKWTWPPALVTVFVISAGLIIISALAIRSAAAEVKSLAKRRLIEVNQGFIGHEVTLSVGTKATARVRYAEKLDNTINEIEGMKGGAFAPLPQDLSILAALLPTGGYGLITLLNKFLF
jgi:hypothetical protein